MENYKDYRDDILKDLATLVSYPSIYSEDEKPFGKSVKQCLHKALDIAEGYGFKTVNVDDYCGYIEMGQGEEIIGILAHLDVVPVSETWQTDPFKLTIIDDKIYGRGTSDDKGAVICSLTALRMLKPLEHTFTKRIRLILGCNEESGSKGIAYYVNKYGSVDCGFTPDGDFPLIYGEKGMIRGEFIAESENIVSIKGGTVSNAVANRVEITLKEKKIDLNKLDVYLKNNGISYSYENNVLVVKGIASHASLPELGVNAISYAFEGLYQAGLKDTFINAYHELISTTYNGQLLGINLKDDYGELTFNVGLAYKKDKKIGCSIDIRFPVTYSGKDIVEKIQKNGKGYVNIYSFVNPLFFPLDHPMINALMSAYQDVTKDFDSKPIVLGGGTYAKEMNNIVAFGCLDQGFDYHIHDDGEFTTEESLQKQVACYYQAILNLMKI